MRQIHIKAASMEEADIFGKPASEVGLKTIQLATVFACDVMLKLNDPEKFAALAQKLAVMYQEHALAAVWFIKWVGLQQNILQELLLGCRYAEIREAFAQLISATFGVVIINEESYLDASEEHANFEGKTLVELARGEVGQTLVPQSAALRLAQLFCEKLFSCARVHWSNFDEFFTLLRQCAQNHFQVTEFLITRQGILSALFNFVVNDGKHEVAMGAGMNRPNFGQVYTLLAYLLRSCMTPGVRQIQRYSTTSIFQTEDKTIELPETELRAVMTSASLAEIITSSFGSSSLQINSLAEILQHLSWGSAHYSQVFMREIFKAVHVNRGQCEILMHHMSLVDRILYLTDSTEHSYARFEALLQHGYDYDSAEH
jgi:hypothetical protein